MAFWNVDGGKNIFPQLCVELDVTNLPTNPTRVWTDITPDVRRISYSRAGRNDEMQRTQPGRLQMLASNKNAKYDPTNPSGIGIRRRQWLRVRAQWNGVIYSRWQGIVETIDQSWPEAGKDAVVAISAADTMKVLNLYDLSGRTFAAQQSDQRVASVCTLAGIPFTLADTGASLIVAISNALPVESFALNHLQQVEESENGLIFADGAGSIVFQSRRYRILHSTVPIAAIGDQAGQIPYRDSASFTSDDAYIFNVAAVTPTNADGSTGTVQTATGTTTGNYFSSRIDRTILVASTSEAADCASFLVHRYGDPSPRVPQVVLVGAKATSWWPTILSAKNSDRVTFKRNAAHAISEDCFVEQVTETVVPGQAFDVALQLSPAADQGAWVLGDAVNGLLGQTTVLAY